MQSFIWWSIFVKKERPFKEDRVNLIENDGRRRKTQLGQLWGVGLPVNSEMTL